MIRSNRFQVLALPEDPYEEFKDIVPYNLLVDGKWNSLSINRHPLYYKIRHRFDRNYDGKLLWSELNKMEEEIEKMKNEVWEYLDKVYQRRSELRSIIIEQKRLCKEDTRESTIDAIFLSAAKATTVTESQTNLGSFINQVTDSMMMLPHIISFLPIETCYQKLQKHLDTCSGLDGTGKYKCTVDSICYGCQFKENGRCEHYYEIEEAREELEIYQYYEFEYYDKIGDLEYTYNRALAVKQDRLDEYLQDIHDDF